MRSVIHPANLLRFGLRADYRLAFGVHQYDLGPDLYIAAPATLASQLNELLGVLRRVEER